MQNKHSPNEHGKGSWWTTPSGLVCLGFLAIGGYFLFTEHRAHIVPYLPYLIFLLCPLMHFFHHGKHHGGSAHHDHDGREE